MLKCKEVRKVWRELNLEDERCRLIGAGSARETIEMMFTMTGKKQLTVYATVVVVEWAKPVEGGRRKKN